MKISVSQHVAYDFEPVEALTLGEIAEIVVKSKNWSCGTYEGRHRNLRNFLSADLIGFDVDNDGKEGCVLSLDEAKEIFSEYRHFIVTTPNHQKDKKGIISDRFRVVVELSRSIEDSDEFYATWMTAKNKWPSIDTKCKDPSRYWNGGGELVQINESGLTIEPSKVIPKENKPISITEDGVKGRPSALTVNFILNGAPEKARHDTIWRSTKDLKEQGYSEEKTVEVLLPPAMKSYGDEKDEDQIDAEIRRFYNEEVRHGKRAHFKFTKLKDIDETPINWVVEGLVVEGTTNVFAGKGGLGKSTFIRQLCKCVCDGMMFLGRRTNRGGVLYIASEETKSILKRQTAIQNLDKCNNFYIHIGASSPVEYMEELTQTVRDLDIKLLVIDSLSDALEGADLNDAGAIVQLLSAWREFAAETNCAVIFIHHVNKGQKAKGRYHDASVVSQDDVTGSAYIANKVDMVLVFSGDSENTGRFISTTKIREGEPIKKMPLVYDPVKFWYEIRKRAY